MAWGEGRGLSGGNTNALFMFSVTVSCLGYTECGVEAPHRAQRRGTQLPPPPES